MAIHFLVKIPSLIWSPVNTAKFFWPIGDRINGVPLYVKLIKAVVVAICLAKLPILCGKQKKALQEYSRSL